MPGDGLSQVTVVSTTLAQQLVAAAGGAANVAATFLYGVRATTSGGTVSAWADANGGSPSIVQATGSKQPADSGGAYVFDGINDDLKGLFTIADEPVTYFVVAKMNAWTTNKYLLDGGAADQGVWFQNGVTPQTNLFVSATGGGNNTDLAVGTYGVLTLEFNGASSAITVNNGTPTTTTTGAGKTKTGLTLGGAGNGTSNFSSVAYKAAFLTTGTRSAGEKAAIKALLYAAYGVTP